MSATTPPASEKDCAALRPIKSRARDRKPQAASTSRSRPAGAEFLGAVAAVRNPSAFCDGSHHAGTGFMPVAFKAERNEEVIFCGCKHTHTGPFCDGTPQQLTGRLPRRRSGQFGKSTHRAGRGGRGADGAAGWRMLFPFATSSRAAHRARHLAPLRRGESFAGSPCFSRSSTPRRHAGSSPVISPPTGGIRCCS